MTRRPVCVHPRASLKAAAKLMAACAVSGVPVVEPYDDDEGAGADGAGRLVGVLSQRDVLWKETVPTSEFRISPSPPLSPLGPLLRLADDLMGEPYEGPMSPSLRAQLGKIRSRTVAHAMTAPALCVEAGALLSDAATIMINRNLQSRNFLLSSPTYAHPHVVPLFSYPYAVLQVARLPVVAPREAGKPGMTVVGILTVADILHHTLLSL
ncbi:unnamed protein product [Closterium sp. Naga37s-1]|nr:unnamed protein product [Closterium sp. Naga37s-1]